MAGTLEIRKISITEADTDAIVNAANAQLQHGGGVCGAIFAAAGPQQLQKACDKIGFCPTGKAVITPGFRLKAKYIIHTVGPIWQGGNQGEPEQLYNCYQASMDLAMAQGCHCIAFPLISSGIYGYPKEEAWKVAIQSILDFQSRNQNYDLNAIISVLDDASLHLGNRIYLETIRTF